MGNTAMTTAIPQFHEVRITLSEMNPLFEEFIAGPDIVNVGETLRVMLGDYFYGEPPVTSNPYYTDQDRTIVFQFGVDQPCIDTVGAIEAMGEIFWTMADTISNRVLMVNPEYSHRPSDCFYKFFQHTRELVVYTPVLTGQPYNVVRVPLDGLAVITVCKETLPSWLRNNSGLLLQQM
jgi:hypothetical protein